MPTLIPIPDPTPDPRYKPFEIEARHLTMNKEQVLRELRQSEPEVIFYEEKLVFVASCDELKLKMETHDDKDRGTERILQVGKDDDGETISSRSQCSASGWGGSHGNGDPVRPLFKFAAEVGGWVGGWAVGSFIE